MGKGTLIVELKEIGKKERLDGGFSERKEFQDYVKKIGPWAFSLGKGVLILLRSRQIIVF